MDSVPLEPCRVPGYVALYESGELAERALTLNKILSSCTLCPRQCRVDRTRGLTGACGVDSRPKIAAASIHPWEEPPISGTRGSGTIFFTGCTLSCIFCQNYPISQLGVGRNLTTEELAEEMLALQRKGAHNINLVTATHQMPAVVEALLIAVPKGLSIPLIHNGSGYERIEILRLFDGIVDIYLPDIKYAESDVAQRLSGRADYVRHNRAALVEMWRQRGPLRIDAEGLACSGTLIRHLVLPGGLSGTSECMEFLSHAIGPDVWVSLMNQYFPAHRAVNRPPLDRKVSSEEYEKAFEVLLELSLDNGFVQSCLEQSRSETDVSRADQDFL